MTIIVQKVFITLSGEYRKKNNNTFMNNDCHKIQNRYSKTTATISKGYMINKNQ